MRDRGNNQTTTPDEDDDALPVMKKPAAKVDGGRKKGWPKGKAKAKAKVKAGAKASDVPGKSDPVPKAKAKAGAKSSKDEPGKTDPVPKAKAKAVAKPSKGEPGKTDPAPKAKAKAGAKSVDVPGKCGDENPKKKGKTASEEPKPGGRKRKSEGDQPTSRTFARRNPPQGDSLILWTAIRDSFYEVVRPFVKAPTKYEDLFWKHCKPKLLELDSTDDYMPVAKDEAAIFLKTLE
ncbi:hypothetical protein AK812_SmicGene26992 [Symbiodinium microadriaticum]|uniref:Uncharacterized protein n=1 Tax=Symbiodinium microadriaticum TaxID=2951 RepID=A0A1Q9D846_SYMMI|nr:hypothetical protein AK812_SmicGene26992 [Symbiodinium microadriaticum]